MRHALETGQLTPEQLAAKTQTELAKTYGVHRATAQRARTEILKTS